MANEAKKKKIRLLIDEIEKFISKAESITPENFHLAFRNFSDYIECKAILEEVSPCDKIKQVPWRASKADTLVYLNEILNELNASIEGC